MDRNSKRWSYSTGERGRNRVRAYEDNRSGIILLEFYECEPASGESRRQRVSLGHYDRDRAKQQADEVAARHGKAEVKLECDLTLSGLFDNYLREVTPSKGEGKQKHDRRCAVMFLGFLGAHRMATSLNVRDWNRFVVARREGRLGPGKRPKPVGNRQVEYDLRWLLAVLNWATKAANSTGRVLLEFNPLKGLPLPKERSPKRPLLTEHEYRQLLSVAPRIDWRFELALVLAHETGHRIGSVRQLRWKDIDLQKKSLRWRADSDKVGFEHVTPLSGPAATALDEAQRKRPSIGDAWVLPAPQDALNPCSRHVVSKWWNRAERLAGLKPMKGRGWHSLRRKFGTELKHEPLKDLCQLGGWKDPNTILKCYQTPDEAGMRRALKNRQPLLEIGEI